MQHTLKKYKLPNFSVRFVTKSLIMLTNLCRSPERKPSVKTVFAVDDVQDLEVFKVELALSVVLVHHVLRLVF